MVFTLINNQTKQKQQEIDIRETFNIWDILKADYDIFELLSSMEKFTHDKDLIYILKRYLAGFKKDIKNLEDIAREYGIPTPSQTRLPSNWNGNPEPTRDEHVAVQLTIYLQEHIANLLRVVRTSITNDKIRNTLSMMLKESINKYDKLYKYMKLKGWIENPPVYPGTSVETKEKICCGSASHLWDLVTLRYDNIRLTKLLINFARDIELKYFLEKGLLRLVDQATILEEECQKFGIPLPKRPPEVVIPPDSKEVFTDDQIYRMILNGLQGTGIIYAEALKQSTLNDRVRNIFRKLLLEEIDFYDNFIKYGKFKGWLNPVPAYKV